MTSQLPLPGVRAEVPPEPVVDQLTAVYLGREHSAAARVRRLFDRQWAGLGVHEQRRLVALRDEVLREVAAADRDADVAHGLGTEEGVPHGGDLGWASGR